MVRKTPLVFPILSVLDRLTKVKLIEGWHKKRAIEFVNETDSVLQFNAAKSRTQTFAGAYTEAPDGTVQAQHMEVFGIRTGPNRSYSGITVYQGTEVTVGIQMHFGAAITVLGAYPYSMFAPDRINVFLGPKNSNPKDPKDKKYWKKSRGVKSSVVVKHDRFMLTGVKGDRADEFTLTKTVS